MVRSIVLPLLILFGGNGCSYADSIDGCWRYVGTVGDSVAIECPDLLVLEPAGFYYVLNDCYGSNVIKPITESGEWRSNESSNELVLSERIFKGNYHLINTASSLGFKVLKLTNKELILSTGLDGKADEKYERLSCP